MRNLLLTIAIMTFLGAHSAQAHLALRGKSFSQEADKKNSSSPKHNLDLMNRKFLKSNGRTHHLTSQEVGLVVPTNMAASSDQGLIQKQIMDKTLSSIVDSRYMKNSALAKTYNKVKKGAQLDFTVKGKNTKNAQSVTKKAIDHKFNIDLRALESKAHLSYKGYFDTSVKYSMIDQKVAISISEDVSDNSKIIFTHDDDSLGSVQWVRFATNW